MAVSVGSTSPDDDADGSAPRRGSRSAPRSEHLAASGIGPYEQLGDAALMGRMRLGDVEAFREFFARFEPLLREVAGLHHMEGDVNTLILEILDDVAERIRNHGVARDGPLSGYLANTLRNREVDRRRALERRTALEREAAVSLSGDGEAAIVSACSSHTLRSVRSPDDDAQDDPADDPVAAALHDHLDALLAPAERQLLGWLGERVPQRDIAEWTGTSHGAIRSRVHRLRERLASAARAWLATLPAADRERMERLYLAGARITLAGGTPSRERRFPTTPSSGRTP